MTPVKDWRGNGNFKVNVYGEGETLLRKKATLYYRAKDETYHVRYKGEYCMVAYPLDIEDTTKDVFI
jgi:hypothetical protein